MLASHSFPRELLSHFVNPPRFERWLSSPALKLSRVDYIKSQQRDTVSSLQHRKMLLAQLRRALKFWRDV